LQPAEEGGPIARNGFNYQDEIAVSFLLDMLDDAAIVEVLCETHDDIVVMRVAEVVEYVQVKSNASDSPWSIASLICKPTKSEGKTKRSIYQTLLERDEARERSIFRLVTLRHVNKDLRPLTFPLESQSRGAEELAEIVKAIEKSKPLSVSKKGNGARYWVENCRWDVRESEDAVKNRNRAHFAARAEEKDHKLAQSQVDTLLDELRIWVKNAGAARWTGGREHKTKNRVQLLAWWDDRLRQLAPNATQHVNQTLRKWFRDGCIDVELGRQRTSYAMRIVDAIERKSVLAALDSHHQKKIRKVLLHGKEGTGKSVIIAQWLLKRLRANRNLFVIVAPAREVVNCSATNSWTVLLKQLLDNRGLDKKQHQETLTHGRWLLVVDGINESGGTAHWEQLFKARLPANVRLILTTRTGHSSFEIAKRFTSNDPIMVCDFNDEEMDEALTAQQVQLQDIADNVLQLMRRPRYFARALKYRKKLGNLSSLTRELLILVDWQSRSEDSHANPTFQDYRAILLNYANQLKLRATTSFSRSQMRDQFALDDETSASQKVAELLQQNFLVVTTQNEFEVNKDWLHFALGLDLLEQLRASDCANNSEQISQALGDQHDDGRSKILSCALNAAVLEPNIADSLIEALFSTLLLEQNRGSRIEQFARLFTVKPSAGLNVMRSLLARGFGAHFRHDFLTILHIVLDGENVTNEVVWERLAIWLGFYSEAPNHYEKPEDERLIERPHLALSATQIDPGLQAVSAKELDCRQLALGMLTLIPSKVNGDVLRRAALSIAIHSGTWGWESFCWLFRVIEQSRQELDLAFEPLRAASPALQRWLHNLLSAALCRSWAPMYAVKIEHNDWMHGTNENFRLRKLARVPDALTTAADESHFRLLSECDLSDFHTSGGRSITDSRIEELTPAMLRFAPAAFDHLFTRAVGLLSSRMELPRARIAKFISDYAPLLTLPQIEILQRVRMALDPENSNDVGAEHWICLALFQVLNAEQREDLFLNSLTLWGACDSTVRAASLSMSAINRLLTRVPISIARDQNHILWALEKHETDQSELIAQAIRAHSTTLLKSVVENEARGRLLQLFYKYQLQEYWLDFVPEHWTYRDANRQIEIDPTLPADVQSELSKSQLTTRENAKYLSVVLAEDPATSVNDLLSRCSPAHWFGWCKSRSASKEECKRVLSAILTIVKRSKDSIAGLNVMSEAFDNDSVEPDRNPMRVVAVQQNCLNQESANLEAIIASIAGDGRLRAVSMNSWGADYVFEQIPADFLAIADLPTHRDSSFGDFGYVLAQTLVQKRDLRAVNEVRKVWHEENRRRSTHTEGGLRRIVQLGFRLQDTLEARLLWNEFFEEVCDDDELLRVTVSALYGNGRKWLHAQCAADLNSDVLHRIARGACFAGVASFIDLIELASEKKREVSAWVERAIKFGAEQAEFAARAIHWRHVYWNAPDWHTALAAWVLHLEVIDYRHHLDSFFPDESLTEMRVDRERYWRTFKKDINHGAGRRAKKLKETLYGSRLPSGIGRWKSSRHSV